MTSVLAGVWVANPAKSRRHANHQFQRATLTIDVDGDLVSLHHAGVNMAGKESSGTTILRADDVEHEVSPQAPGVVVVARWDGPHILETEAKKSGRTLWSLSADYASNVPLRATLNSLAFLFSSFAAIFSASAGHGLLKLVLAALAGTPSEAAHAEQ